MKRKWLWITMVLMVLTVLAVLIIYSLPDRFCRFMCDDFVSATITQTQGVWGGISYMYVNLTGRYSVITVYSLYNMLGNAAVPWTPVLGLLLWLAALTWTLRQTLSARSGHLSLPLLAAALFMFYFLQLVPNLFQLLYWPTAMLTYLLPIIGITLLGGIGIRLARRKEWPPQHPWRERIVFWLAVFLVAGFTETYAILLLAALGFALLAVLLRRLRPLNRLLPLAGGGVLLTMISLLVQINSPGLTVRGDLKNVTLGPLAVVLASLSYAAHLAAAILIEQPIPLLTLLIVVSFLFSRFSDRPEIPEPSPARVGLRIIGAAVVAVLIMAASMTPSFQALGRHPYNRVLVAPIWVFATFWLVVALLLAPLWRRLNGIFPDRLRRTLGVPAGAIVLAGLLFTGWGSVAQVREYLPSMKLYAQAWDQRDLSIRVQLASGQRDVVVNALPAAQYILDGGARELGPDPDFWLNQTIAQYYGADSLVTPPLQRVQRRRGQRDE